MSTWHQLLLSSAISSWHWVLSPFSCLRKCNSVLLVKWQYSDLGAFCCNGYSVSVLPILQMSKPWLWAVTRLRWVSDELSPVSRPRRVSSSPQNSLCPILFWEMGFSFANQHATSCQNSSVHVTGSKLTASFLVSQLLVIPVVVAMFMYPP